MATTTPNFGWSVPTSTDLVKNGATAIETLGDSIDASMADLKGGTTGQVLAKATGTDMDFTWTTPSGGTNSFYAGKNKIINGDFGIWQRGTSGFGFGASYNADRWAFYRDGSGATEAITQQTFTAGTAPVAGYESQYFWRYAATVAGTGATERSFYQRIENVRTFANQTVTVSFWAKADAARTVSVALTQNFGSGGSASVTTALTSQSLTTSWARYSASVAVPSISGKTVGTSSYLQLVLGFPVNVIETIDIWGVQVEAGSTATDFVTASGGSPQAELAMCQRYYYRQNAQTAYTHFASGGFASTTTAFKFVVAVPVEMRVVPTSVDFNALAAWDGGATYSLSSIGFEYTNKQQIGLAGTSSGMTANRASLVLSQNNTAAYLGFSAEL